VNIQQVIDLLHHQRWIQIIIVISSGLDKFIMLPFWLDNDLLFVFFAAGLINVF